MTPVVSVLIPSREEVFLDRTIADVLAKAVLPIEIIVILDGYAPTLSVIDPRVTYVTYPTPVGMRTALATASKAARGDFLMKLDAHCLVQQGLDQVLANACGPQTIVIPRRYRLNEEAWTPRLEEGPVDYEYFIWPKKFDPPGLHGFHWVDRTQRRLAITVDPTLTFQGSCWFMPAEHFRAHRFLEDPGYQGLPQQEAEELGLTTWTQGGRVMVVKDTWYAHLFKGKKHGRGYRIDKDVSDACYRYSFETWVYQHRPAFKAVIEQFWPIPGWPDNWEEKLDDLKGPR
jgi:glycosyltransferase involved in cell wall biosynthesis